MSTPENQTPPEGVDTGEGRPDWLPENFKTPEDLAKSYSESRKEMDKLRSERDEERAQFAAALERIEAATQQQATPAQDPQANQLLTAYAQAVENGDAAAMLSIQLALNQQATAQVIDERLGKLTPQLESQSKADRDIAFEIASERVAKLHGEQWAEIQPEVQTWLKEHPAWLPATNSPEAFEAVIAEAARTVTNEKAAEKLKALEADRTAKLTAQTATGSGSGKFPIVTDEKKQEWDAVKNADLGSYSQARAKS